MNISNPQFCSKCEKEFLIYRTGIMDLWNKEKYDYENEIIKLKQELKERKYDI